MKSPIFSRIIFITVLALIGITQGFMVHASQGAMNRVTGTLGLDKFPLDILQHYP
jgi:hypothetical protein